MYKNFKGENINILEFEYEEKKIDTLNNDESDLTVTPDYDYIGLNNNKSDLKPIKNSPGFERQFILSEMISEFEDRVDMSFLDSQTTLDLLNEIGEIDKDIWYGKMERKKFKTLKHKINLLNKKIKRYERFANY